MSKIIGNTTTTPIPRSNWEQTDKTKADFIRNKPTLGAISKKDTVSKTDLTTDVQSSLEQIDTKANIVTLSTEEYEVLESSGAVDANTLYMLTDVEEEFANVIIDLSASNEGESNIINADTLGGKYESDLSVSKSADSDRLGGILASEYAMVKDVNNLSDEVNMLTKHKAGFIYPLASDVVPDGFLLCDGAEYLREEYPELFIAIGTTYGSGDGSTTFNVPNLATRVPVGKGTGYALGATGGEATHTLTVNEMPSHEHSELKINNNYITIWSSDNTKPGSALDMSTLYQPNGANNNTFGTGSAGGGVAHNNMQPYTVVNYIIATGKNTSISVQDVINGVQALPLGVEYGGTGTTNLKDLLYNLEMSTLVINECTRNTTNTTADYYNTFSASILGICILNISLTISSDASSSYTEYVIATNCQKPAGGLWSPIGLVSGNNNETKKCFIDPDGNLIIDSGSDGIANKYLSGTLIYYVEL